MAMENILTIIPMGAVVGVSFVTGIIVWLVTAISLNRRWKKIFWPHADNIAEQKITKQEAQIQRLSSDLSRMFSENTMLSKQIEGIKKLLEVL